MRLLDPDIAQAKALVIDGNPVSRSALVAMLKDAGIGKVEQSARVADARRLLESRPFDIVLCEYHFPGETMTGQDLIDDLHCTIPVGIATAALGGQIEVPTLGGKAEIELPEGTQHGKTFRLRGKGIKGVRSSYPGDLYCHVTIETPIKLTEHQRKLLKELDESFKKGGDRHSPNAKSWTDRVKDLFK